MADLHEEEEEDFGDDDENIIEENPPQRNSNHHTGLNPHDDDEIIDFGDEDNLGQGGGLERGGSSSYNGGVLINPSVLKAADSNSSI